MLNILLNKTFPFILPCCQSVPAGAIIFLHWNPLLMAVTQYYQGMAPWLLARPAWQCGYQQDQHGRVAISKTCMAVWLSARPAWQCGYQQDQHGPVVISKTSMVPIATWMWVGVLPLSGRSQGAWCFLPSVHLVLINVLLIPIIPALHVTW